MTGGGLTLDPAGGWPVLCGLAAALLPLAFVGPRGHRLAPPQRRLLTGLRLASLALLLALGARPAWETVTRRQLPAALLLLADQSRSMQVEDAQAGASRFSALRNGLEQSRAILQRLAENWEIKAYAFADGIVPLTFAEGRLDLPSEADGGQTALGAALDDALSMASQQRIVAVVLLSDGAQRAFAPRDLPPQNGARRLATDGVPLLAFTYGQPALGQRPDLRVSDLLASSTAFAEAPFTVEGRLTAQGYANQEVAVKLLWETPDGTMETVDARTLTVEAGRTSYPLKLSYTPRVPGEFKATLEVRGPEGELVSSNNRQSTFVTVRKGGVSVLYLAGAARVGGGPGIEPRFVRAALAAHADLNVAYELFNYRTPQLDYRRRLEEAKADVFLLGDLDASALDAASWEDIAARVERGAGLAMLGGLHSFGPGGFRGTPLENVVPIEMGRAERQNFGEPIREDMHLLEPLRFLPVVRDGRLHPLLQLDDQADSLPLWQALPRLDGANRFDPLRLKPNALTAARADNDLQSPLLVLGAWGEGRSAALAVDSTWHWQLEGFGELHRRFWRQFVLWLARKDADDRRQVGVRLDQRRYQPGSRVDFVVGAADDQGRPLATADFDVQLQLPDGSRQSVRTVEAGQERRGSFAPAVQPGDYRLTVTARAAGETLGATDARFLVVDQDLELDQPAAEPALMAALAEPTAEAGGGAFAPEELPEALARLEAKTPEYEEQIVERVTLWDRWPALLAITAVLSAEWFLRKRWGLA